MIREGRTAAARCLAWGLAGTLLLNVSQIRAESALELIAGFDAQRIDSTFPVDDSSAAGELARLLYRLGNVDASVLAKRAGASTDLGDAVPIRGRIASLERLAVPERLVELLGFSEVRQVVVTVDSSKTSRDPVLLFTHDLPEQVEAGDRISGVGLVIGQTGVQPGDPQPTLAVAAGSVKWFPADPARLGWRLLADAGVDLKLLTDVARRDRQPLVAEDAEAFYSLIAAAEELGGEADAKLPASRSVQPVVLLKNPDRYVGEWIGMTLETVRITRVVVTEPKRRRQLGSDHYYQIDAVGDLGEVQIQIERPDGQPARFNHTYPVSVVAAQLPEALEQQMRQTAGGDAAVALLDVPIRVEGFFYRLWSYQSDFMKGQGGAEQFGPLVIAAKLKSRAPAEADPIGVSVIGWVAAAAAIIAIAATFIWTRRVARRDQQVRRRRQQRESNQLKWPGDDVDASG